MHQRPKQLNTATVAKISYLLILGLDDNYCRRSWVTVMSGARLSEFSNYLDGKHFTGTVIS